MHSASKKLDQIGSAYNDFIVTKCVEIPELQCMLRELVHQPTGAHVMAITNDDPENLFCLSFRTVPKTSNGVAHILEHTVLCGSKKFPVKDPFFAMHRRSLNTYMNALTGADFTCYPAASQVEKDFYNLLDVYLDAVFYPNLNELSFLQEGHRLEFAVPGDVNSPLENKGIVFNEMKGALSSPEARLIEYVNANLYPDLTYGVNSGGDPKVIPELTYEEMLNFHKEFYHPCRCLFFFYGNMPLEKHLDFIADKVLNGAKEIEPLPGIKRQNRFKHPVYKQYSYPISVEEEEVEKTYIAFAWLTCDILDQQDVLGLNILETILMDTDASKLKMAFLKSGMCKQASGFMDDDISEVPVVITLKGCDPGNADALETLMKQVFQQICEEGIPDEQIESAIHQLEFHRSEILGDHYPFGLSLFFRSALMKQHGADPEKGLRIHSLFNQIRQIITENPNYLIDLLKKYFIDNPHFVRIVMTPDKTLGKLEIQDEQNKLNILKETLTPEQKQEIVLKTMELEQFQEQQDLENLEVLPKVYLTDISEQAKYYPLSVEHFGNLKVYHHSTFTNDILYADLVYNLPALSIEEMPEVRFFSNLLAQMGCGDRNYEENLNYIQANTGGLGSYLALNLQAENGDLFYPTLHIKGKALNRNADKLLRLIKDTATAVDFSDLERLKEVIEKHFVSLQSSIQHSPLKYAINLSASKLTAASRIANEWYGLPYFWKIQKIASNLDEEAPKLQEKLTELKHRLLGLRDADLVLTCQSALYKKIKDNRFYGMEEAAFKKLNVWNPQITLEPIPSQARIIASPVAFISKVFPTVSYIHPDAPALSLIAFLLDNIYLHTEIREKGGAYGAGAASNALSKNFYFYSYRDPNVAKTLIAFKESIEKILRGDFDETDLEEAKLEMIQALDTPISPGSRGALAYSWLREGLTLEIRQRFREALLQLTKNEVVKVCEKLKENYEKGAAVVFSGLTLAERENRTLIEFDMDPLKIEMI